MYYKLKNITDRRLIGSSSGIQTHLRNAQSEAGYFLYKGSCTATPRVDLEFDCFELNTESILTDFVSWSNFCRNLLIAPRVLPILEAHQLPKHGIYDATIRRGNENYAYKLICFFQDVERAIDFTKTTFLKKKGLLSFDFEAVEVHSLEELKSESKKIAGLGSIIPETRYYFREPIDGLDLVRIGDFDRDNYVSPRLKDALVEVGATGIGFQAVDYLG